MARYFKTLENVTYNNCPTEKQLLFISIPQCAIMSDLALYLLSLKNQLLFETEFF